MHETKQETAVLQPTTSALGYGVRYEVRSPDPYSLYGSVRETTSVGPDAAAQARTEAEAILTSLGWEITGQWEQTGKESWQVRVKDSRKEGLRDTFRELLDLVEDPDLRESGMLPDALEQLEGLLNTAKAWKQEQILQRQGAIPLKDGGGYTRPGETFFHDPHAGVGNRGKTRDEWMDGLIYYRVGEDSGRIVVTEVDDPGGVPGEDAQWFPATDLLDRTGALRPVSVLS